MFRLQVTIIRQTFKYMDMRCSVLTIWDPILFTFYTFFTWFHLVLTVKILSVHCVFLREEKNFSGLHRNSARQELRFKILLCIMIIFIMNVLLYSFYLSRNVNGLTFFVTTNRSIQKTLYWSTKLRVYPTFCYCNEAREILFYYILLH
jgi:hypothetical protein